MKKTFGIVAAAKTTGVFVVLAFLLASTGCVINTYSVMKERPDQQMEGNQGYLMGGSSQKKQAQERERKTYVMEIEMGKPHTAVIEEAQQEAAVEPEQLEGLVADDYYVLDEKPITVRETYKESGEVSSGGATSYTVKQGDTLEKIAGRPEIYGKKSQWKRIYDANKETVKNPDRIKPGQVLIIPR